MTTEERRFLYGCKRSLGHSDDEASQEVKDYLNSQKAFKELKRENKSLRTENSKLRIQNDKYKQQLYKLLQTKSKKKVPVVKKTSKKKIGQDIFEETISDTEAKYNQRYLTRMKTNTPEGKVCSRTYFIAEQMIPKKRLPYCISQLIKSDFLKEKIVKGDIRYIRK